MKELENLRRSVEELKEKIIADRKAKQQESYTWRLDGMISDITFGNSTYNLESYKHMASLYETAQIQALSQSPALAPGLREQLLTTTTPYTGNFNIQHCITNYGILPIKEK